MVFYIIDVGQLFLQKVMYCLFIEQKLQSPSRVFQQQHVILFLYILTPSIILCLYLLYSRSKSLEWINLDKLHLSLLLETDSNE